MARYADTSGLAPQEAELWGRIIAHQGETFHTARGLPFTYRIAGNEVFFSRKEKPVTLSGFIRAYRSAVALGGTVPGPKTLNVFGASYIYPLFLALGVISPP